MKSFLLFIFFILLFTNPFVFGLDDSKVWNLEKDQDGIKVYTRMYEGFNFKEVRVINRVQSTLSGMVGLLLDTKNYPLWVYGCKETNTLKVLNDHEIFNYQVTDLPWPLSDRDVVAHFKVMQNPATKVVIFSKTGMADYIPAKDGMVRVQNFQSICTMTPLTKDSVEVVLEMHLQAGGSLPAWVVNDNMVMAPFYSTVAMIKRLPFYQTSSFSFIKEK